MRGRAMACWEDEAVLIDAVTALLKEGLDRARVEKAVIRYAPVDLDFLASCYATAIERVRKDDPAARDLSSAAA